MAENQKKNRIIAEKKRARQDVRWMRLDNAAKIYPAARHKRWSNVYRLSATLKEKVDKKVLQQAVNITAKRFPSISARLRRGLFWYYLEELKVPPTVLDEKSYPLCIMSKKETSRSALRVIAYKNRIAVEFFHSLTDGNGALIFLKTLLAEYLTQKYGADIPCEEGVYSRTERPKKEELEDNFLKNSGKIARSRNERDSWRLKGTPTKDGFLNLVCFKTSVDEALKKAHSYKVSLNTYLCAVLMKALINLQEQKVKRPGRRKPIKIVIPVNLRNIFGGKTLRNFALYITPYIDTRLGEYSMQEICNIIHHKVGLEANEKHMRKMITTNVNDERSMFVKLIPLFIKNVVMKIIFTMFGERKSCLTLSNLGAIKLPGDMKDYFTRFDFILGSQAKAPHNCGVLSFNDTLYINFIRNIVEPELEYHFYKVLEEENIKVTVESNYCNN